LCDADFAYCEPSVAGGKHAMIANPGPVYGCMADNKVCRGTRAFERDKLI
jgi:hypothetical protein